MGLLLEGGGVPACETQWLAQQKEWRCTLRWALGRHQRPPVNQAAEEEPRLGADIPSRLHGLRASGASAPHLDVSGREATGTVAVGVISPCGVQEREVAIIDVAGLRHLPQTAGDGRPLCLGRLWRRRGAPIKCLQTPQQLSRTPSRTWLCRRVGRMRKGVRVGGGRALLVGTVQRMPSFPLSGPRCPVYSLQVDSALVAL